MPSPTGPPPNMLHLRILFLLIALIFYTGNVFAAGNMIEAYNSMDESEKFIFDTIPKTQT